MLQACDAAAATFSWEGNHQKPCECPPGGTRARCTSDPAALFSAPPLGKPPPFWGIDGDDDASSDDGAPPPPFEDSNVSFGSTVPITAFMLEEFCWLFFGRGGLCRTSDEPKMSEWPPPGGFRTRLDGFASPPTPTLKLVDISMLRVNRSET